MKPRITDVCHIDGSSFLAVQYPPAVRKFVQEAYIAVLTTMLDFVPEATLDGSIGDHLDVEHLRIDWQRKEIDATVNMNLKFKFELTNGQLEITEVEFD